METHDSRDTFEADTRMFGKRVLVIGVIDARKDFIWDVLAKLGVQVYALGPRPEQEFEGKLKKFLRYDCRDHSKDRHHCDVIVDRVIAEIGGVDGCLSFWDTEMPLTALVAARLGRAGVPYDGVLAAKSKAMTFDALLSMNSVAIEPPSWTKSSMPEPLSRISSVAPEVSFGTESWEPASPLRIKDSVHNEQNTNGLNGASCNGLQPVAPRNVQAICMRNAERAKVSASNYASVCVKIDKEADIEAVSSKLSFPAVMKTEFGTGGMGTKIVESVQDALRHFQLVKDLHDVDRERAYLLGQPFTKSCVLMEYLEGSEHCVDLALFHGELVGAFVSDKGPQIPPDVFKTAITMPSLLPEDKLEAVIMAAFECCRALGLDHGVFDVDIMLTKSGPKLLEINPRMGGYCQREFILQCYNVDLVHLACMIACDVKPDLNTKQETQHIEFSAESLCTQIVCSSLEPGVTNVTLGFEGLDAAGLAEITRSNSLPPLTSVSKHRIHNSMLVPDSEHHIVGIYCHPVRQGKALKSTATPDILQRLHDEKELIFVRHEHQLRELDHEIPYCTVAVKAETFDKARARLVDLCQETGLETDGLCVKTLLDFFTDNSES